MLLTENQKKYIATQYKELSSECQNFYNEFNLQGLKESRIRLQIFIETIENLFNIDFYQVFK